MQNKEIIIGIDCDDVLNNLIAEILDIHKKQTGIVIKEEEVTSWSFDGLDIDKEKVFPAIMPYELRPKLDNIEALENLYKYAEKKENIKVYVVSQCRIEGALDRIRFIKKYYPEFDKKKFISIEDKSLIRLDYLVDDAIHNADMCAEKGTKVYLLDMPHNRNVEKYERISNLDEFVQIIKREL